MKTGAILTGVVAITTAVPAVTTRKESSVPSAAIISARQHIGCEDVGTDHKCSYYKDDAKIEDRSGVYHDARVYSPTHAEYKPSTYTLPAYTSAFLEYKSSPEAYDRPKRTSADPAYRSTPTSRAYDLTKFSSAPPEYKWTPILYLPPHHTSMHSKYKPTMAYPIHKPIHEMHSVPTPSYGRRGNRDPCELPICPPSSPPEYRSTLSKPTHYDSPAFAPPSPVAYKSTTSTYPPPFPSRHDHTPSSAPYETMSPSKVSHGNKPEASYGDKPKARHGGRPQRTYGARWTMSTSSPFCDFVESECVDCSKQPDSCDKKQCTYRGLCDVTTLCKEIGEACQCPSWFEGETMFLRRVPRNPMVATRSRRAVRLDISRSLMTSMYRLLFHGPHGAKSSEQPPAPKPSEDLVQGPKNGAEYPHGPGSPSHAPDGKMVKSN
ncbi:hypothetical protein FB567DRAFT_554011 [Paraphoma chrysanthemicola]|uniref:Uncharacterized protein n=1 Tax=Paraphoma chrysanthemicola TaxID=798071 RepID=A0A8K0VSI3_9PLEO|nr:hypothetical protein FB567DRAFT_554011 [Paraphoma chrysanthemicola]